MVEVDDAAEMVEGMAVVVVVVAVAELEVADAADYLWVAQF